MENAEHFDFVIFGSGFGGSILSMVLRRIGYSVLLLERGEHPRFVIGESSTPFANLLLERLAETYELPFLRALSEWGTWQREYPALPCGLKRGFTFYHHLPGRSLDFRDREMQLLIAASPNDSVADTHWYRPEFDHFLVRESQRLGVVYRDRATVEKCEFADGWNLIVQSRGDTKKIRANFAIDASGSTGFLANHLQIPNCGFTTMPKTRAVYAHFRNVARLDQIAVLDDPSLPYRPDDAAVHHVFPGGWIWVLRFNTGITSAGAALEDAKEPRDPNRNPEQTWHELINRFPSLQQAFSSAETVSPFYELPEIAFRRTRAVGPGWALLPSAVGFVDPLLSTGFALNLLGIFRLGSLFAKKKHCADDFLEYEKATIGELVTAADLISAMYSKMDSFADFAALSLLYFAAMSYTETAWRLGRKKIASGFLLNNDSRFSELRRTLCERARRGAGLNRTEMSAALSPWDIAGLADLARRNWYPVNLNDLIANRAKLNASMGDLQRLFSKLGLVSSGSAGI